MFVGAEHSHQTILNLTDAINDAMEYDLPVLGVTAVGKALKDKKKKIFNACIEISSRAWSGYCQNLLLRRI